MRNLRRIMFCGFTFSYLISWFTKVATSLIRFRIKLIIISNISTLFVGHFTTTTLATLGAVTSLPITLLDEQTAVRAHAEAAILRAARLLPLPLLGDFPLGQGLRREHILDRHRVEQIERILIIVLLDPAPVSTRGRLLRRPLLISFALVGLVGLARSARPHVRRPLFLLLLLIAFFEQLLNLIIVIGSASRRFRGIHRNKIIITLD